MQTFWGEHWGTAVPIGISVLSLILSAITYVANQKTNLAQPDLITGTSLEQRFEVDLPTQQSIVVVCRTKLYINNFGTSDTLLDTVTSRMNVDRLPLITSIKVDYAVDTTQRSDYKTFDADGVSVLTAFHNWGEAAPNMSQVFKFYNEYGPKFIREYVGDGDGLTTLSNIVEPLTNVPQRVQNQRGIFPGPSSAPKLLQRQTMPGVIRGKQLTTVNVDHVIFYLADDAPQGYLLNNQKFGGELYFSISTIDGTKSSKDLSCQTLGEMF